MAAWQGKAFSSLGSSPRPDDSRTETRAVPEDRAMLDLGTLFSKLKTRERVFIQTHDFPDHDAIASAFGMQKLLESRSIPSSSWTAAEEFHPAKRPRFLPPGDPGRAYFRLARPLRLA
jgi:c-di-AMP phosphodiesterase-like protein